MHSVISHILDVESVVFPEGQIRNYLVVGGSSDGEVVQDDHAPNIQLCVMVKAEAEAEEVVYSARAAVRSAKGFHVSAFGVVTIPSARDGRLADLAVAVDVLAGQRMFVIGAAGGVGNMTV